jgi:hypothetical protein
MGTGINRRTDGWGGTAHDCLLAVNVLPRGSYLKECRNSTARSPCIPGTPAQAHDFGQIVW